MEYEELLKLFSNRLNVLCLDDMREHLQLGKSMFDAAPYSVTAVTGIDDALRLSRDQRWHCWILDYDVSMGRTGIELLERTPDFPFTIILSGIGQMECASRAMHLGARAVFDKSPDSMERMYGTVCQTAVLGYLLKGSRNDYLHVFDLLCRHSFYEPQEWASLACVSVRQLERLCMSYTSLTPNRAILLYRALVAALQEWAVDEIDLKPIVRSAEERRSVVKAMQYVSDHFGTVYTAH
jgi:CheY-like chemotaxis protein